MAASFPRWLLSAALLGGSLGFFQMTHAQNACNAGACVLVGPRLASFDSSRGDLSNALFSALLGSNARLSILDWNALASSNVSLAQYVGALGLELSLATPAEALTTRATLFQFFSAATTLAEADGNTALVSALNTLSLPVAGLSTPLRLGDLLQVSFPPGSLTDTQLNLLSLVTGLVQLYNYENVVTTRQPVTLSASALSGVGLGGVLNGVEIFAQVVEPPIYTCGGAGTTFYSAAIRLKLNLDLVDLNPGTGSLVSALTGALGSAVNVQAALSIGQLELYVDVARAQGVITSISALSRSLTLTATPGLANLYLGHISDTLFYNRTRTIGPSDVTFGTVGSLQLRVTQKVTEGVLANATTTVLAKAAAEGVAPFASSFSFSPPYPQTQTASSSTTFVTNLLNSLVGNLHLQLGGSLGALLDPLVNGIILPTLSVIVRGALTPVLAPILSTLADPLLATLGIRLGEVDVTVFGVTLLCDVSGTLYHDRNRNSARDAGEDWQGDPAAVVNVVEGSAVIASSPVSSGSGAYTLSDVQAGTYSLIVTTSSASVTPNPPTGFFFVNPASGSRPLELGGSGVGTSGQDFGLAFIDPGRLTLVETVRNVTALEATFVTANGATPADTLEYRLVYSNLSRRAVSSVRLTLTVPPETVLLEDSYGPAGELELVCPNGQTRQLDTGPATLLTVAVSSQCGLGELTPGESGVVRFRARVR